MEFLQHGIRRHSARHDFLALVDACHSLTSRDMFLSAVYPALKKLLPHQCFICGVATVKPASITHAINVGFPITYAGQQIGTDGSVRSPLIRAWLQQKVRYPVFFDTDDETLIQTVIDRAWKKNLQAHGISTLAAHGQLDVSGIGMSYFCFSGIDASDPSINTTLKSVVPHLHIAISHPQSTLPDPRPARKASTLSLREKEVLKLICIGKTNAEIADILGISAWTVKIHVKNFMTKLDVSTRGHAVAKALRHGVVG